MLHFLHLLSSYDIVCYFWYDIVCYFWWKINLNLNFIDALDFMAADARLSQQPCHVSNIYRAMQVYKALNGLAPMYISNCLKLYVPKRNLRSFSDCLRLDYPITRNKAGDRTFTVYASKLWNNLPMTLRNCTSVNAFKKALKTHFPKLIILFVVHILLCMFIIFPLL